MKRSPIKRTKPMRRRSRSTKYSRRPRDLEFMAWVRDQLCSVEEDWPDRDQQPTACLGPIQADHDSRGRGLGQKSDDRTCIPLCLGHHTERTDHSGTFKHLTRDQIRAWFDRAQARLDVTWNEHHGEVIA